MAAAPETGVWFAVFVEVGGGVEAAVLVVEVEDAAFADVEEEACINAASGRWVSGCLGICWIGWEEERGEVDLLLHVLVASAFATFVAATSLAAEHVATE